MTTRTLTRSDAHAAIRSQVDPGLLNRTWLERSLLDATACDAILEALGVSVVDDEPAPSPPLPAVLDLWWQSEPPDPDPHGSYSVGMCDRPGQNFVITVDNGESRAQNKALCHALVDAYNRRHTSSGDAWRPYPIPSGWSAIKDSDGKVRAIHLDSPCTVEMWVGGWACGGSGARRVVAWQPLPE